MHKQPTSVTVDAGQPSALTSTVLDDSRARAISSSKPGSNGNDAATTKTIFYTAGANTDDTACGLHPEWAGQPCATRVAGPVTGYDATWMAGQLSVKRITGYNKFGSPTVVTESVTGPVAGATVTQTRTSTTAYDAADRVTSVSIAGTGTGVGAPVATTYTVYDGATGDVVRLETRAGTVVTSQVTKAFDALGRLVSYTDADGGRTVTTYDQYGRPVTETQTQGPRRSGRGRSPTTTLWSRAGT